MKIKDIIQKIEVTSLYVPEELYRRTVLSLCHNSKTACPTCAFFCKKGAATDGHDYAYAAYINGARIFVAERELNLPPRRGGDNHSQFRLGSRYPRS